MIAHNWKFLEVKEIFFVLLFISICFNAINGAPINTTSTEEINGFNETNEYLSVMMRSYPILKRLTQYFTVLNNKNLLSARGTCKSFYGLASEELNRRIRPLIIRSGEVSGIIEQQIFSTYEQELAETKDFLKLQKWQPQIALLFDDWNNRTLEQYMQMECPYFQMVPQNNRFTIFFRNPVHKNYARSVVIIPEMFNAFVDTIYCNNAYVYHSTKNWEIRMHKVKLIIVFRESAVSPSDIESDINSIIAPLTESRSVPICYVLHIDEIQLAWSDRLFVMFSGSNIEASTFLVETNDEEKLRGKFLKWKSELNFLDSHHITVFHFTKESMESMNSEKIFSETFDIQPITLRLSASELIEIGLIYCNSTTKRNPGSVYAIVGYKKF